MMCSSMQRGRLGGGAVGPPPLWSPPHRTTADRRGRRRRGRRAAKGRRRCSVFSRNRGLWASWVTWVTWSSWVTQFHVIPNAGIITRGGPGRSARGWIGPRACPQLAPAPEALLVGGRVNRGGQGGAAVHQKNNRWFTLVQLGHPAHPEWFTSLKPSRASSRPAPTLQPWPGPTACARARRRPQPMQPWPWLAGVPFLATAAPSHRRRHPLARLVAA